MITDLNNIPWAEKYRPKKIEDVTQDENILNLFKNCAETQKISHFMLYGPSGTGKTSTILALGRELFKEHFSTRVIEFNASDDRGINAVREKITAEAKKYVAEEVSQDGSIIPSYKIIILDEADSMTDEAQDALRVIIEQYSNVTRFCFICNYISKITSAIKSRCCTIFFRRLSDECMLKRLRFISEKEDMDIKDSVYNDIIDVSGGDMRKALIILQNVKHLYNFNKIINKDMKDMTYHELNFALKIKVNVGKREITDHDIYHIAGTISRSDAVNILTECIGLKYIKEINCMAKKIIRMGYPIDNIISQLNKTILAYNGLSDVVKAMILRSSGDILYKIKSCGNDYIQLIRYLSMVNKLAN